MAIALLFLRFASVGLSLTLGFVAEDLLAQGSPAEYPLMGSALIVATASNGMAVMRCFSTLFSDTHVLRGERDQTTRESWDLSLVMGLLVVAGAAPGRSLHLHGDVRAESSATGRN